MQGTLSLFGNHYPELYDAVLVDVSAWFLNEIQIRPINDQMKDNVQTSALLNFITFDMHALITEQGFVHMQRLLQAEGTDQTVMLRLKELVVELYVKYGEKAINKLRKRVYRAINVMYGLSFNSEDIDVNNTFWLYPFLHHAYILSTTRFNS